jgi:hypothetical protein
MRETGEALLAASDAEIAMALDHPEPPVPARVASSFSTGGERALGDAR